MNAVRFLSKILYGLSRLLAVLIFAIVVYATVVTVLFMIGPNGSYPIEVLQNGTFRIFYPFTRIIFLLGDYTAGYLLSYLLTMSFYGLFLWLLSNVFHSFSQERLFTKIGAIRLSRFYIINLLVPVLFIAMVILFGQSIGDMLRIILLHLVIGAFAFFMAAIFKQGLILQDEQDLIF